MLGINDLWILTILCFIFLLRSLNLPVHFTSVDEDYRAARSQLNKLNTHHKSQAQQEVEARINLNVASLNKDESAINVNMGILYTAGHTDADDDIKKGKRQVWKWASRSEKMTWDYLPD